jgi:hypothetical protein
MQKFQRARSSFGAGSEALTAVPLDAKSGSRIAFLLPTMTAGNLALVAEPGRARGRALRQFVKSLRFFFKSAAVLRFTR